MRWSTWRAVAGAVLLVGALTGCEGAVELNASKRLAPENPVVDGELRDLARAHSEAACRVGALIASPDPETTYGPGSIELIGRERLDPALGPPRDDHVATTVIWNRWVGDPRLDQRTWDRLAAGQARCADGYLYLTLVLRDDGPDGFAPGVVRVTAGEAPTTLGGISTDGATVVVRSGAADSVVGTTSLDLYLYDVATGEFRATGIEPQGTSQALSSDGSTLLWDDESVVGGAHVFTIEALDLATGTSSVRRRGTSPAILRATSGDGRRFAFELLEPAGTTLLLGEVGGQEVMLSGQRGPVGTSVSLSDDGRVLAAASSATLVMDLETLVIEGPAEIPCLHRPLVHSTNGSSISGDGRYLAYTCVDQPNVAADRDGVRDLLVWDRTTGRSQLITSGADGRAVLGDPSISDDGRFVAFAYQRPGSPSTAGTYLWDRTVNRSTRIAPLASDVAVSGDGSTVAFTAAPPDRVAPASTDLYVWENPAA